MDTLHESILRDSNLSYPDDEMLKVASETGIAIEILKASWKRNITPQVSPPVEIRRSVRLKKTDERPILPKRRKLTNDDIIINKSSVLHSVDVTTYHEHLPKDENAEKILELSKKTLRTLIDIFDHDSKTYFVMCWLSVIRLFEYKCDGFVEVRRIPKRFISLNRNIITCIHYCEPHLLYSYMLESGDNDSCLEIRNLDGETIVEPYHYDHIVRSINSNKDFIFTTSSSNIICVHRRELTFFHFPIHRIDMGLITPNPVINALITSHDQSCSPTIHLISATSNELLSSNYDLMNHRLVQSYQFEPSEIKSIGNDSGIVFVHRDIPGRGSRVDMGCLTTFDDVKGEYFLHNSSICFTYRIIQIIVEDHLLYLFGYCDDNGSRRYELGLLDWNAMTPVFVRRLTNVNEDCRMLRKGDIIVIVQECQRWIYIDKNAMPIKTCEDCHAEMPSKDHAAHLKHPGILRDLKVLKNKHLIL